MSFDREIKREERIAKFLEWDKDDEILEDAVKICARIIKKKPRRASHLVSMLSAVVATAVDSLNEESCANWGAAERAVITQQSPNDDDRMFLYAALPVVKQLFPEGRADIPSACPSTRSYFNKWLKIFEKSDLAKTLDIDSWAKDQGHYAFLKLVLEHAGEKKYV